MHKKRTYKCESYHSYLSSWEIYTIIWWQITQQKTCIVLVLHFSSSVPMNPLTTWIVTWSPKLHAQMPTQKAMREIKRNKTLPQQTLTQRLAQSLSPFPKMVKTKHLPKWQLSHGHIIGLKNYTITKNKTKKSKNWKEKKKPRVGPHPDK